MKNQLTYIILTIILTSCNVKDDLNDMSKRDGNWYWITDMDKSDGRWVPKGNRTTVKEGMYKYFNCKGWLHSSGVISNFESIDTTLYYDSLDLIVKKEFRDKNGVKRWLFSDGNIKLKYATCELESEGEYIDGLLVNEHFGYYKNGALRFHFQRQTDSSIVMKFYEQNGVLREERTERSGLKEGKGQSWYKSGKIDRIIFFNNNMMHGEAQYFYESGQLEIQCSYENDLLTDSIKTYYENGNLMELGYYKDGKEEGTYLSYYNDGQVKQRYFYVIGKMDGRQLEYSKEGKIVMEANYSHGVQISFKGKIEKDDNK